MFRELSSEATEIMTEICDGHAITVEGALGIRADEYPCDDIGIELLDTLTDGEWDVATAVIGGVELFANYAAYETWNNQV